MACCLYTQRISFYFTSICGIFHRLSTYSMGFDSVLIICMIFQFFIIDHNIYLQNGECACVTLPPASFHYWARHLFREQRMYLRHTTACGFSILSTTFIYRMVNVLALHYELQLFIIEHEICLHNGECTCVTLPPADFHY